MAEKRKLLVGLCKTRWWERDISYERFYLTIPFITESLEIINGTHSEFHIFEEKKMAGMFIANGKLQIILMLWPSSNLLLASSRYTIYCIQLQD